MNAVSEPGRVRAQGKINVRSYDPQRYGESGDGPALSRIHVEEQFLGDIEGEGVAEFLQAQMADGSASFVGMERVAGSIHGRRGTFLLQDHGTLNGTQVSGHWFVIPDSASGELVGLRGEGGFTAQLGEGADISLDYWFA
jgi:hypothetical protein